MIEAKIANLAITDKGFAVILKPDGHERVVPIFIGTMEAQSISIVLLGLEQPRPLSHDLFKNIMHKFEVDLEKIVVNDLRNDTFYAVMVLHHENSVVRMDSRPSDAIALALRLNAPIFVEEKVIEEAGIILEENEGKVSLKENFPINFKDQTDLETLTQAAEAQQPKNAELEAAPVADPDDPDISERDRLSILLERAVVEERYEDAAALRDKLKHLDT